MRLHASNSTVGEYPVKVLASNLFNRGA